MIKTTTTTQIHTGAHRTTTLALLTHADENELNFVINM
jgi:hypothetical protein